LIANCISTAPDKACLSRTHGALSSLSSHRNSILTHQRQSLTALNRKLSALQSTHQLTTQSHNPGAHAHEMHRLDAEKFRIAKEASEHEIDADRLAKDIAHARRLVEEGGDVEGGGGSSSSMGVGASEDEMLLKLKVYRMLGIDVERDSETGVYQRAVVRNSGKGDVKVVNIDPKFSRYFYANFFWDAL